MSRSENTKTQAVAAVIEQMRLSGISLSELTQAMNNMADASPENKRDIATRLFTMLGGIFIFAGVGVYIGMFWNEMNSAMRIGVTLGIGLVLQALALLAQNNGSYPRAVKPLQLIALILQPTGWFVAIYELFPHGSEPRYAILFVMMVMAIQQTAIFFKTRPTLVLLAALAFAYAGAFTLFSLMHANENLVMVAMGFSMMAMAQAIHSTPHAALSRVGHFIGGLCFYWGAFELLHNTPLEILYLALTCLLIYLSTWLRSGALLAVSALAMLSYIGYFTEQHFVDSVGWPLSLVALGCAFFAIGGFAFRLKKRYLTDGAI